MPRIPAALFTKAETWRQLTSTGCGRMDGEDVVYKYTHRILLSYKRGNSDVCNNKDEFEGMRMSEKLHTEKDEHSKISLT